MQSVGLFIFDLDGTLVNTLEDITASLNYTLVRLGRKPLPLDRVRRYIGDGITMLMTRALEGRTEFLEEAVGIYKVHHSRHLVVRSRLYPQVAETLGHFRELLLAVVTNKAREFSAPLLEQLGIRPFFRTVIGADEGLPLKPAPDAFLRIMKDTGVPPADTVVVGDGLTDLQGGRAAGATTCAVTYGFRSEEELQAGDPDFVIHAFSDLKTLFAPARP